ncbi:MAG: DUF4159 domain-containing protein [Beijerinckiaceae bacterium]
MLAALTFASPLTLAGLALLPVLYWLLRVTPPNPRRIDFPPLRILLDLIPEKETVARTPWWLLALRLAVAAAIIMALAGPIWNARRDLFAAKGPLLLVIDNGWAAAPDWKARLATAEQHILVAQNEARPVALLSTADWPQEPVLTDAAQALEKLRSLTPLPHTPDHEGHAQRINALLDRNAAMSVVWIADGLASAKPDPLMATLSAKAQNRSIAILREAQAKQKAISGATNAAATLDATIVRAENDGRDSVFLRALDKKGAALAEARANFSTTDNTATAKFELPLELRNDVARIEIVSEPSAAAQWLLDGSARRRRVAIVTGATQDTAQPLLAPTYYLTRALAPFAEVREGRGAPTEAVLKLLEEKPSVVVLADVGTIGGAAHDALATFVREGGVLVRFAGSRLAAANDDLVPVKLRRGGRTLGGTLSWETPKTLAPIADTSPFKGLKPPAEVQITRQILAEPEPSLSAKTWAALSDGTPVVTGETRGKGLVALFHVTADTTWSNLPLSGLFVDMLRTLVNLSSSSVDPARGSGDKANEATLAPLRTLDGFGAFRSPPPTAKPIPANYDGRATADHPPGFYGSADDPAAVNILRINDVLLPLEAAPAGIATGRIESERPVDLRPWLLVLALCGFILDTFATLLLGGMRWKPRRAVAAAALLAFAFLVSTSQLLHAQTAQPASPRAPQMSQREKESALTTKLAYVVTGDATIDAASKAGLTGLTLAMAQRTSLDAGDPAAVDPARDDLSFYPFLYWPIAANRPMPAEAAIRALDAYMKNGGTVMFDTRDAYSTRTGSQTPENQMLRRLLASLDVPELEAVPRDHVVTKAFYLLDKFPGRYDTSPMWIEALPPAGEDGRRPARAGDGVSPILITGNDLAAAWAVNANGDPLYPINGGDPRQREFAIRGGVNIVLYTLTGNYKADQVHVPALLERLGQ